MRRAAIAVAAVAAGLVTLFIVSSPAKDTYWYLSAAPELLTLAGQRLERALGERS